MPDKKTIDQQAAAKRFAQVWKDRGYEKGDSRPFGSACRMIYLCPISARFVFSM